MTTDPTSLGTSVPVEFLKDTKVVIEAQALRSTASGAKGSSTSLLEYQSLGHCLIVGELETALQCADQLTGLKVTIAQFASDVDFEKRLTDTGIKVFSCSTLTLTGYLGQFDARTVDHRGEAIQLGVSAMTESGYFDLVLDLGGYNNSSDDELSNHFLINAVLPPFGYYRVGDEQSLSLALLEMPGLTGEFEKPKYFNHNAATCAHQRSLLTGCTRCIDVCSTGAISGAGDSIVVDPYLCQGCGHCATVCPSGAMTYAYPQPADAIAASRTMISEAPDVVRILLLHKLSEENEFAEENESTAFESELPAHVLPIAVEEVGAFGIDYWASVIAAGIERIVVMDGSEPAAPTDSTNALQHQIDILQAILVGLGRPANCVVLLKAGDEEALSSAFELAVPEKSKADDEASRDTSAVVSANFSTHNDKRQTLRFSIDYLLENHGAAEPFVALPEGSPFGQLAINANACTLCLACVSTCPAGALVDGQNVPQLRFIEANCVQCGICTKACPEDALTLQPRFLYDSGEARQPVVLNEEEPFNCVMCHKPFATRAMIDNMSEKLAGHWMFEDEKRMRRLKMCEDCRVKDMFLDGSSGIEVHRDA